MKVPRKLKKKIPKGYYCYTMTSGFKKLDNGGYGYTIKTCEFWDNIKLKDKPKEYLDDIDLKYPEETIGWCKLLRCEIEDQCKSCGSKMKY